MSEHVFSIAVTEAFDAVLQILEHHSVIIYYASAHLGVQNKS